MTTPQQLLTRTGDRFYLTDGGLETTFVFHETMPSLIDRLKLVCKYGCSRED